MDHPNYKWTVSVLCWTTVIVTFMICGAFGNG